MEKVLKRISKVFADAEEIIFDDSSKIILMSDVHRGNGSWSDDFMKNQNSYYYALTHYYNENFTYIEIGDGDELWKNKKLSDIMNVHSDIFLLLSNFYHSGRLHFIFGNHDMEKQDPDYVKNNMYQYFDEQKNKNIPLFEGIKVHEGLVLKHRDSGQKILLIHGHQASFWDYNFWKMQKFLVRNLWGPLETFGTHDPTSTAKNYVKKKDVEQKLAAWAASEKHILIAGHTHRPMYPEENEPVYFNDGSGVHPSSITGIEIAEGSITLVKWNVKTEADGTLFVCREILEGPRKLSDYLHLPL